MSGSSSLAQKLAAVMLEVGTIAKRGRNEHHKYDYVLEADIVEALRQKLASRNVVLIPSCTQVTRDGTLTTAVMSFTLFDGDSGENVTQQWAGYGQDSGDKGLYKAYTGAVKYFLMKLFMLPTGDDPEGDPATDKAAAAGKGEIKAPRSKGKASEKPAPAAAPVAAAPGQLTIRDVASRPLNGGKVVFDVTDSNGEVYVTFSNTLRDKAKGLIGKPVVIQAEAPNRFGDRKLSSVEGVTAQHAPVTEELTADDIPF